MVWGCTWGGVNNSLSIVDQFIFKLYVEYNQVHCSFLEHFHLRNDCDISLSDKKLNGLR